MLFWGNCESFRLSVNGSPGSCTKRNTEIAAFVEGSLKFFDGNMRKISEKGGVDGWFGPFENRVGGVESASVLSPSVECER
ncbi:MAG: hypothetical protein ACRC2T_13365 [Thermoguttaceae bacterium]